MPWAPGWLSWLSLFLNDVYAMIQIQLKGTWIDISMNLTPLGVKEQRESYPPNPNYKGR